MNYKVLYRKYRPTNFDDLVGQEHIKTILKNSIINNKIAHAYIFTGPRGTGKTSTAKIFAKTLNCTNSQNGIPCNECENCKNFLTTPDIIEMDAASNNSVNDIREIIDNITISTSLGKYKIYIIDEVHMLSKEAWNAFLKTLEEPPANVIFILATTDIQKVPITVLSRCQRFDFQRIDRNLIFNNLKNICDLENIAYEDDALIEIAYLSDGCMRDALSLLDQLSKISEKIDLDLIKNNYGTVTAEELDYMYSYIIKNDIDDLINLIEKIKSSGIDIKIFINKILENFLIKAIELKKKNISSNAFKQLKKIIESLNNLLVNLNSNSNGYLLLELELIAFINDESNQITNREINQIISREIIKDDTEIDVSKLINSQDNNYYKLNDEFINIRINNCFVGCSKQDKLKFANLWDNFKNYINSNNIIDIKNIILKCSPQVCSSNYCLFVSNSDSIKIVANNKLYDIENKFNTSNNTNYKFIFITKNDWNEYMKNYDKNKKYDIIDEDEYINTDSNSVTLAQDVFGSENLKID